VSIRSVLPERIAWPEPWAQESTERINHAIAADWNVDCGMRDGLAGLRRKGGQRESG